MGIRVGNYRIIHEIHDEKLVVLIMAVGHRRDIHPNSNSRDNIRLNWTAQPRIGICLEISSRRRLACGWDQENEPGMSP